MLATIEVGCKYAVLKRDRSVDSFGAGIELELDDRNGKRLLLCNTTYKLVGLLACLIGWQEEMVE